MNSIRINRGSIRNLLLPHSEDACKIEAWKEAWEEKGFKISFLGGRLSRVDWDEQVKQNSLGVRGKKLQIPTITFIMVLTHADGGILDSKELLPKSTFESKGVEVSERSIDIDETRSSRKKYSILTMSAQSYRIDIIRASNLYLDEETPHCVHLPSELWQLVADSEADIQDFGSKLPVRASMISKSAEHIGKDLTPKTFNPIYLVPEINRRFFRFGIHFEPLDRSGGLARIFYAKH